jgi:DNA-binding XRE family transcriptional regulator
MTASKTGILVMKMHIVDEKTSEVDVVARVEAALRSMRVTPRTCRAARALLGIQQSDLAGMAGVNIQTVRNLEAGKRTVHETWLAIRRALVQSGIMFIDDDGQNGEGVRLRQSEGGGR